MVDHNSFSALDRHAVLGDSDAGFPWYASAMLAVEAGEVMRLRMEKLSHADAEAEQEAILMVSEKITAAFEAVAGLLSGATPAAIINRYRARVADNIKRLSASEH